MKNRLVWHCGHVRYGNKMIGEMSLTTVADVTEGRLTGADAAFSRVSTDTRQLQAGDLFVALCGENFDGHAFLGQAEDAGAVAAVVSEPVQTELATVCVRDTRLALGQIAAVNRSRFSGPVVAITGSCGKTTCKEMVAAILSCRGNVLATQGNFNNEIGVPLTLLSIGNEHDFAVIEMGAAKAGDIAYLSDFVAPDVAMVTNVSAAHLKGFGSIDTIAVTKGEIYGGLPADGVAVINHDDGFAALWREAVRPRRITTFSLNDSSADFHATNVNRDVDGVRFAMVTPGGDTDISIALPGDHNVSNALAAAAMAMTAGASISDVREGLANVEAVTGRMRRQAGVSGATVIDDTYNANPASVKAAIDVLAQAAGKKVLVLGDMAELGENAEQYHRDVGEYAIGKIDSFFSAGELSALAAQAFGEAATSFTDKAAMTAKLRSIITQDYTVLIKGSRSSHMEEVVAALTDASDSTGEQ